MLLVAQHRRSAAVAKFSEKPTWRPRGGGAFPPISRPIPINQSGDAEKGYGGLGGDEEILKETAPAAPPPAYGYWRGSVVRAHPAWHHNTTC